MRGRKPKPTALKILSGAQKCRINKNEVASAAGSLEPPATLTRKKAIAHWREVAPVLHRMGLLTEASRFGLAQLCDEFAIMQSTVVARSGAARDRYRRLLIEFGLTPSAQSRLKAPAQVAKDKLAAFLEENVG